MNGNKIPDIHKEVLEAEERIREHILETPLEFSPYLSGLSGGKVYLKLENMQFTGSFKLRGAINKYLSLPGSVKEQPVITASTGNHGAAVAYAMNKFGGKGIIYLPANASGAKIDALREYNADLEFYGNDCIESESQAKETADKAGYAFISPYADIKIIGGQGTVGVEILRHMNEVDSVLVPVGGGGLISGVAGFLKAERKDIEIIGCQPENSKVMYESVRAGKLLEMESLPTLADGTAGGIEENSITFDICKEFTDRFILVKEEEIKNAIKLIIEKHFMLIEGAAALSVASFVKDSRRFRNKIVVLVVSGKKISIDVLRSVLSGGD